MGGGDLYSTFVSWTKVILPTVGLLLLSTLFLFSGRVDVAQSVPYTTLNVDDLVREQRLSNPYLEGVTDTGRPYRITAAFAKPAADGTNLIAAEDLELQLGTDANFDIRLTARNAEFTNSSIDVSGNVRIRTGGELLIVSDQFQANLET